MGALGIARLAGVLSLAILPCAANTTETVKAEALQLRPPTFNSSFRDLVRARAEQGLQRMTSAPPPGDPPRMAERCANNYNMPTGKAEWDSAPRTPLLFLLVGRGSGGSIPMPNGCDPKVDSLQHHGRN